MFLSLSFIISEKSFIAQTMAQKTEFEVWCRGNAFFCIRFESSKPKISDLLSSN